ncbi:MAG: hypothetical protein ABS63_11055 [Microbacterium sp. SCN 70-27]|uniref:hypothetical protein n=1 Tax=unclassified Microbacterium TaxID=2609290 RepID=UPI00086B9338|nr:MULTISPECIES: hypothetical protein [unclassified Microbacterium]MBN9224515.1 hypothetical protein [Microbacterium sp.]ODT26620.1 MAG: hypothetical protein ABS63_11055 [Microbacterium sp. SCN 70-27]
MARSPFVARALLTAVAAATLLGLTACAAGAPATDTAGVAPATGELISGTGYTYSVPEGWADPGEVPGFSPDSIAADLTDDDGFADNVNVILSPAGKVTPEQVESAGVKELEGAGATDVTVQPRVKIAGQESAHLSAALASGGTTYAAEQYYVSNGDQTYVVTFSFSPTVGAKERVALAESVLASWKFTG